MRKEELFEIMRGLRITVLDILNERDLRNDREAQATLLAVDDAFRRLDLAVEDVVPIESILSYFDGIDLAGEEMANIGMSPAGGLTASVASNGEVRSEFKRVIHLEAVAQVNDNLMTDLKSAIRTARVNANVAIERALSDVKDEIQQGLIRGDTRRAITARVSEAFEREGMTSFITRDGRKLPLDFYSEVVTRTNLRKASTQGSINRYKENNVNLVQITGNTPTCSECYPYRDVVFSIDGKDKRFPRIRESELPPFHPNCQCSVRPFVIKYKSDEEIREALEKDFKPNEDDRPKSMKDAYDRKQKLNQRNNLEKKEYLNIKAIMGDEAPQTLGAFRRMKRKGTDNYKALKEDYQETVKNLREKGVL